MRRGSDYRDLAKECRDIAKKMPRPEDRARLEEMARAWDTVATEREHSSNGIPVAAD